MTFGKNKSKSLICLKRKIYNQCDIIQVVKQQKWRWAGHVARMNDNRWTKRLTDWHPYNEKRSRKRPDTRWKDEIEKFAGVAWHRITLRDRKRSTWIREKTKVRDIVLVDK